MSWFWELGRFELNELMIACELVLFAGWGKVEL
jgi:hypothetical protein